MPGRKPTAKAVKEMTGAAFKNTNRVNHFEPKGNRSRPAIPESIANDRHASSCWNTICDELDAMGILVTSDRYAIEIACKCYSDAIAMREQIGRDFLIERKEGVLAANPGLQHLHKFEDRFANMLKEIGMSPSGRLRLHAPDPEADGDEFQSWLAGTVEEGE